MPEKRWTRRYVDNIPLKYVAENIEEWASRGWAHVGSATTNAALDVVILHYAKDPSWQAPKWNKAARKRLRQWVCFPDFQKRIEIKAINLAGSGGQVTEEMVLQAFRETNRAMRSHT